MADIVLSQAEADDLLAMEKLRETDALVHFPDQGGAVSAPLVSADGREKFILDLSRGRINRAKLKYQTRGRVVAVLARLDIDGPTHRNPDQLELPCPHLHLYREGFGDKWAFPVDPAIFTDTASAWSTLVDFQRFCNITAPPNIPQGLFV